MNEQQNIGQKNNELTLNSTISWLMNNVLFIFFVAFLAITSIFVSHSAENTVRNINKTNKEIKKLRWEYMTLKAELMYKSKQTEIADLVKEIGLEELKDKPTIIKDGTD